MRFTAVLLVLCALPLLSDDGAAGDWPSWRGPNRDDISTETGLLKQWPEGGPKKLWTSKDAGLGYSGVSIVGDVLYTMGADGTTPESKEFVIALNVKTGEKIWQTNIGPFLENGWGGGPRSTPAVAEGLLVAIGGKGDLVCLSVTDGAEKWRASFTELGGAIPSWGYCESALIDGDKVLVTPGGANGTVACFNLKTGEKLWQSTEITVNAHYSSILPVDHFGKRQYIQLTEAKVFGIDGDGKLLWQQDFPGRVAVIPTPIYKDGSVYVTAGYGVGCMMINVTADNKVEKIYENKVMKNHHGGVVLIGDHLYGHADPGWVCQDFKTGESVWMHRGTKRADDEGFGKGAIGAANGMLYAVDETSGSIVLVAASPEGWKESGRFTLDPQTKIRSSRGRIWTHPVISNGKLYLRDQDLIFCYDVKAP